MTCPSRFFRACLGKCRQFFFTTALLFILAACSAPGVSQFEVQRPSRISVPREVRKVFISSELVLAGNDRLKIKSMVLKQLASELNRMGRFEATVVESLDENAFDPEKESVALIQGEVISGGEMDRGQFTDIATCTGGLGGRLSSAVTGSIRDEAITMDSWRGYVCRKGDFSGDVLQGVFTSVFAAAGLEGAPPKNQVVRVYEYRNVTLFAQMNFSFTLIGNRRETLAIRADAASYGRQLIRKDSYRNVQEVHNIVIDFLGPLIVGIGTPIFPIPVPQAAQAQRTNPREAYFTKGHLPQPSEQDLPDHQKNEITRELVGRGLEDFIRTISPYKMKVGAEVASGGMSEGESLLLEGKALEARQLIEGIAQENREGADWYNLGLAYEASAINVEDYEDARRFYIRALEQDSSSRLFAQGVARTERYLAEARTLREQTKRP